MLASRPKDSAEILGIHLLDQVVIAARVGCTCAKVAGKQVWRDRQVVPRAGGSLPPPLFSYGKSCKAHEPAGARA